MFKALLSVSQSSFLLPLATTQQHVSVCDKLPKALQTLESSQISELLHILFLLQGMPFLPFSFKSPTPEMPPAGLGLG